MCRMELSFKSGLLLEDAMVDTIMMKNIKKMMPSDRKNPIMDANTVTKNFFILFWF